MRHKRNESRLRRLMRRITGRTERTTIGKHSMRRPVPETVSLMDDDDDLMALARALYPERYERQGGEQE